MMPDDSQRFEIEKDEAWFHGICADPPAPDTDRIRRRVRIAIHEAQLHDSFDVEVPADLIQRTQERVRVAVAAQRPGVHLGENPDDAGDVFIRLEQWLPRVRQAAAGLGFAAAACLLLYVGLRPSLVQRDAGVDSASLTTAFSDFAEDDLDGSLGILSADLAELELAYGTARTADVEDLLIDDLLDAIETIPWDEGDDDEWS